MKLTKEAEVETSEELERDHLRNFLFDKSVDPNHQGKYGFNALIRAVQNEDKDAVETLLSCPRVDVNLEDDNGY